MRFRIDILVDRANRFRERSGLDGGFELHAGGFHQRRVERTADVQLQRAFRTGFGQFGAGGVDGLVAAGDHQLAGAVVVGRDDHTGNRGANLFYDVVGQADDGGHRRRVLFAGLLHGHCAFRYEGQAVFEAEGAGGYQCAEFAQRVAGDHFGGEFRAERFGEDHRMQENSGLRNLGLFELFVGSGEHDVGDRKAEDFVGFFEQFLGCGHVVVQVFAHADELGALAREYECFHLSDVLGLNIFSVGAVLLLLSDRMVVCCAGTARLPETGAKIHIFRHSRSGRG